MVATGTRRAQRVLAQAQERLENDPEHAQLVRLAWERGLLSYKFELPNPNGGDWSHQRVIYDEYWRVINDPSKLKYVANVSRRFGKSFVALLVAFEYAIRYPNSRIKVACPTQAQMGKIIEEVSGPLLADCPVEQQPRLHWGRYTFKNRSTIQLAGADGLNADRLRGTSSDLVFIDEAAFVQDLKYLISSILMPTMLKNVGSTLIAYSTPASSTDHYFTELVAQAKADDSYICKTIDDDPTMTPSLRQLYAREYGGEESTEFQREYLCRFVTDSSIQVLPEFNPIYMTFPLEKDDNYLHYHKYVALDIGVRDNTAAVFGYYDFKHSTLVIEDEYTLSGSTMTTQQIADALSQKEEELWGHCYGPHPAGSQGSPTWKHRSFGTLANPAGLIGEPKPFMPQSLLPAPRQQPRSASDKVYRRIGDTSNLLLLQDLSRLHQMTFNPVKKGTLYNMINALKMLCSSKRLQVHPRCVMTIGCLEKAYWNQNHTAFAHSKTYAHFDHLAALIYLVISLDERTNPLPSSYGADGANVYYRDAAQGADAGRLALANALLGKRSGKS